MQEFEWKAASMLKYQERYISLHYWLGRLLVLLFGFMGLVGGTVAVVKGGLLSSSNDRWLQI